MKMNGPEMQEKHAWLYFDPLQALKGHLSALGSQQRGFNFCICSTPLWDGMKREYMYYQCGQQKFEKHNSFPNRLKHAAECSIDKPDG